MTFSWKRLSAIFMKDYKDFTRNMAVSVVVILPIIIAAIYGRMGTENLQAHFLYINMTFAFVATYVQCCLIAEEKEKNTLRGLMLSPASTFDILGGKSLLSFVLTILVIAVSLFVSEYTPKNLVAFGAGVLVSTIFYIAVGTLLGLIAKSVMEASVLVLPVAGIFTMGSFLTAFADKYPILQLADYMPNLQLIYLAESVEAGAGFVDILSNLGIISIWAVLAIILTTIIYKKRMVD